MEKKKLKSWVRSCLLISLIKCLKGHKSLGLLFSVVKPLIVSGVGGTDQGTRSPIELLWTANKNTIWNNTIWKKQFGITQLGKIQFGILLLNTATKNTIQKKYCLVKYRKLLVKAFRKYKSRFELDILVAE